MGYSHERRLQSDRYLPAIRRRFGEEFRCNPDEIRVGNYVEDLLHSTDLVLPDGTPINCRVREPEAKERYYREFTLRRFKLPGQRSEYEKVKDGEVKYLFTAFGINGNEIDCWWLLDAAAIAKGLDLDSCGPFAGHVEDGGDQNFDAYRIDWFPPTPPVVYRSSEPPMPYGHEHIDRCRRRYGSGAK